MSITDTARIRLAALLGLGVGLSLLPAPAAAQEEWKVYTRGKTAPIVANFYAEESPWVFYRDDQSMYIFALGCNRVTRVERGGSAIPLPACPVEQVRTNTPRIIGAILDLESKRLDDAFERLRGIAVQFNNAAANATVAAANAKAAGLDVPTESLQETLETLKVQLDEVRRDLRSALDGTDALIQHISAYRERDDPSLRARYFFAPR